jgi:hypothetical protein
MDFPLIDPLEFSQDFFRTDVFQRHKPNHCALFDHRDAHCVFLSGMKGNRNQNIGQ